MNVIYGILSVVGWAFCAVAFAYLFVRLRREPAAREQPEDRRPAAGEPRGPVPGPTSKTSE